MRTNDKPTNTADTPVDALDESLLADIESLAVDMARESGEILARHFGKDIDVEYKDDKKSDPVSTADRESQEYQERTIRERFPGHTILGEEVEKDGDPKDDALADFVWVLDPLDGTKNFLEGLPVYACSIGVLYRGAPVVGAIYVPWPAEAQGLVLHARQGAGAFVNGLALEKLDSGGPRSNSLITLPGGFGWRYRFLKPMRGKVGDVRMTGSIAYELAMVAKGVLQYSMTNAPRLWDVAAGAVLVRETGGLVMVGSEHRRLAAFTTLRWEPLETFWPGSRPDQTTLKDLRSWSAPMVYGSAEAVRYVTANLGLRRRLRLRLMGSVARLVRSRRAGERRASHKKPP